MKKWDIIKFIFVVINAFFLIYQFSDTNLDFVWNALGLIAVYVISATLAGFITVEINKSLKVASREELKTEDSVLLRGIGLLQSTAFIYINLLTNEENLFILILKITIPIFSAVFFILRGYGSIKESPVHRHISIMVLFWYLIFETCMFIALTLNLPENIITIYFILAFGSIIFATYDKLAEITSTRYGIQYISLAKRKQIDEDNINLEKQSKEITSRINSDKTLYSNLDTVNGLNDSNLKWLIERSHDAYLSFIALWLAGMLGIVTVLLTLASTTNFFYDYTIFSISIYTTLSFGMVFALYRIANILEEHIHWGMQIEDDGLRNEIINHRGRLSRFVVNSEGKLSKRNRNLGIALQIIFLIIFFLLAIFSNIITF